MRRALLIVPLLLLLALGAWGITWYFATQRLMDEVGRWAQARRGEGFTVSYGAPRRTGFPLRVAAELDDPEIGIPAPGGGDVGWTWRAPALRLEIVPWRPDHLFLRNSGENRVSLLRDGQRRDVRIETPELKVRIELGRRNAGRFVIELEAPRLTSEQLPVAGQATRLGFDLELFRVPPGDHRKPAAELAIGVSDLTGSVMGQALPAPVTMNLQATLMGAIPPGRVDQAAAAWRDDGGTVEVTRLLFQMAGVHAIGNGTLALDNDMRVMGAASAAIHGHDEAIDRLTRAGVINPRDAMLAKLMLAALARPDPDGSRVLNVPVTAQDGWLHVGPVRLFRLEPLWRAARTG